VFAIVLPIEGRSVTGRRLRVAHSAAALPRGLEPEEYVVLRDADLDRRFLGRVVGIEFDLEDTYYDVQVDGALAAAVADRYVDDDFVETQGVAALLGELAGARARVRVLS